MRGGLASKRGTQAFEAILKIGFQIVNILQSDLKAECKTGWCPRRRRALSAAVEGDDEALEAAPGTTHA